MKIRIVYERQVTTLDVPDEECAITIRTDYEMRLAAAEDKESVAPRSMQEIMDEQINRPEVNQDRRFNDHNVTESALAGDDDEDPFFDLIPDTRQEEGEDMLNLHATFTKGTVEFRLFQFDAPEGGRQNGIHAGQLKSYIQLCLALSEMAKEVRTASPKPQQNENPKYAMRTWLLRLGFIGEEFATARDFLTRNLDGDTAFRHGRAAA